jgi:hypothetical protein
VQDIRIAPTQTRTIPIKFTQSLPFRSNEIWIELMLMSEVTMTVIAVFLPIKHVPSWTVSDYVAIKSSYFYAESTPTSFLVIPPIHENLGHPCLPILALRTFSLCYVTSIWH